MNIAWFKDLSNDKVELVGGKGASLGEMFNSEFPIPNGFCVTATAFKNFIEKSEIDQKIFNILKETDVKDNKQLQENARKVQKIILDTPMLKEIEEDILDNYEILVEDDSFVAVRSSATAEDLPSISENEHILIRVNGKPVYKKMKDIYSFIGDGSGLDIEIPSLHNKKITWKKVSEVYKHKCNYDKLYKIITETGREIVISPNHSLIILDEENLVPKHIKSIKDLEGSEMLPVINQLPLIDSRERFISVLDYVRGKNVVVDKGLIKIKNNSTNWKIQNGLMQKISITNYFAYFLGVYVAEGSTYGNNCVMITNSDKDIMKRIIQFYKSLNLYNGQKINKHTLRIYCKPLLRFLHEISGKPSKNIKGKGKLCRFKEVPDFVFSWNRKWIGEFLRGAFDGDGHVSKSNIDYCSSSSMLIGGLVKLLEMLGIEFYLRRKGKYQIIEIPIFESEKFEKLVGFEAKHKIKALKNLVKTYKNRKNIKFKNRLIINSVLSSRIRNEFEKNLPKENIQVYLCPSCGEIARKNGNKRCLCGNCGKTFYKKKARSKVINSYVYFDEKGRFKKSAIPWNKARHSSSFSVEQFKELTKKYDVTYLSDIFDNTVKWDRIKKIVPVDYRGYVYDFTVPNVENFAAGIGGIITHNSASFAGQQATYLNVKGEKRLLASVKACWASLYTSRAIFYRVRNNFPHEKVYLAVVIQRMVNSEKAGVMFSVNPVGSEEEVLIEATFGLGESVVSGSITPDEYTVNRKSLEILGRKIVKKEWFLTKNVEGETVKKDVPEKYQQHSSLSDEEIKELAGLAVKIEEHYKKPQDLEFAIEGKKVFIVQSRPITTLHMKKAVQEERKEKQIEVTEAELLVSGLNASPGVGRGHVKIVRGLDDLGKVKKGDVLVARMTTPDYVPAMERASAIVTDTGGTTAHAAIVGREMGLPVVVGTEFATKKLKENDFITVDATKGKVYRGDVYIEIEKVERVDIKTDIKIKVIMDLPDYAERAAMTGADGVGLLRGEFINMGEREHPVYLIKTGRGEEFISHLVENLKKVVKAFKGKPVWYRTLDAPTDEFRSLPGGEDEPHEDNPMMGWRSIRRALDQPELLKAEFEAIRRVHEAGFKNLGVMLPLVTDEGQVRKAKKIFKKQTGLIPLKDIEFGIMIETPASVQIIEELCKEGISFVSFGTNDLTQFTLAVDRNSAKVQKLFDEMHPAVLRQIHYVIKVCKKYNVKTSICGQAGSKPEMAAFLYKEGINSISANPDAVNTIRKIIGKLEGKI